MEKFTYLILDSYFVFFWFLIYLFRKDLRQLLVKISIAGGFIGLLSELWYFNDYWRPITILGNSKISIEDFIFGFTIMGIAFTLYKVVFRKKCKPGLIKKRKFFSILFVVGLFFLVLFSNILKINSIFISSFIFLAFALVIAVINNKLAYQSVVSGILLVVFILPFYFLIGYFNLWGNSLLLSGTTLGTTVFGNIPLTELLWYFCFGCFGGIAYDFYHGSKS